MVESVKGRNRSKIRNVLKDSKSLYINKCNSSAATLNI